MRGVNGPSRFSFLCNQPVTIRAVNGAFIMIAIVPRLEAKIFAKMTRVTSRKSKTKDARC
ncbi:hypothetical protein DYI23_00025 [Roseibium polysiphoniae]|uniref:Uncharacterized protein n=1 Tax=Roseibium polysiphoniae TaxID=2571221 RepID=A0A944CAG2_9HYPH|nr:hypothetical protein [Roseibium polysiphoniae]